MKHIHWFSELDNDDTAIVGGKNASLGEMIGALKERGIRVPDGFATTAEAYWRFLDENDLSEKIREQLGKLQNVKLAKLQDVIRHIADMETQPA